MSDVKKTPLIRLAKRDAMDPKYAMLIRIGSILLALIIGSIPIILTGVNPFKAYGVIIKGSLSNSIYLKQTIKIAIPLLVCSLAIGPCFKMKFWNIGAEGQLTFGAICSAFVAINLGGKIPSLLCILLMAIAGALGGGLWGFLPGLFKAKFNTNETLFTLMMNYIAIGLGAWLQGGPWEGRKGTQIVPMFDKSTYLPEVFGVQCGWIVALLLVVFMHIYMNYTKHGYEVAVIGDSENTARYAGMNVGWIMMRTMILSGAICGIAGFLVLAGANHTFTKTIANGVGFTAITVSWLSQLNAFVMIAITALLAVISKGSSTLNKQLQVPTAVSEIVSGVLLFCMLSSEFFINYKIIFRSKADKEVKA
ncbi:MAG: ABC transporter permease [Sphaerochaetaceae bacterium]|nr:ABC transporter permease [Sphaerochaetaceae bacterium]